MQTPRAGIVLITPWWRGSIDHDGYARALRGRGYEPVLFCAENRNETADFEVVEVPEEQRCRREFWSAQRLDAAIVWNWLHGAGQVRALKAAGARVILRADSDGYASDRAFPWLRLKRTVSTGRGLRQKLGLVKWWLQQWIVSGRRTDLDLLETVASSDTVIIESEEAKRAFNIFLIKRRKQELGERIRVVPHSVRGSFLAGEIPSVRERKVVCSGRWDDPQKGAKLLRDTLLLACKSDPKMRVVIFGKSSRECFEPALGRMTNVQCRGVLDGEAVRDELQSSQVFLASSKWESQPIGALEAVCEGCTIVAPSMPGFDSICQDGRFGSAVRSPSPARLNAALRTELDVWERGARAPGEIAAHWRERLSAEKVVSQIMASAGLDRTSAR